MLANGAGFDGEECDMHTGRVVWGDKQLRYWLERAGNIR